VLLTDGDAIETQDPVGRGSLIRAGSFSAERSETSPLGLSVKVRARTKTQRHGKFGDARSARHSGSP
jgi:hypothetical protein